MAVRSIVLAALIALVSCSAKPHGVHPSRIEVRPDPQSMRIVSLVPSITEDIFAVGAGKNVVGVSSYTDYPPEAKRLPVVATFASIATERIVALHANLAVGIDSQARFAGDLDRAGIARVLVSDDGYDDIFGDLVTIGEITGHAEQAARVVARLHARTDALRRMVPANARKPSVFVVLGDAPVFTVGRGSFIAKLIDLAGGTNAAGDLGAPYARYSAEALIARQPDVLVVDPDIHLGEVLTKAPWSSLRAVREHRVYTLPDAAILERPGPRYNDGLAWLIGVLAKARSAPESRP